MSYLEEKTLEAIEILREYEPSGGYYLAFSGGKDSIVCYNLLVKSGCKFDAHYNVTTIDLPDILVYMKSNYPDVIWDYPLYKGKPTSFYKLIETHGLPARQMKFCCEILKEYGGFGRFQIDGLRSAESHRRSLRSKLESVFDKKNRKKFEGVELTLEELDAHVSSGIAKKALHIIFDWSDNLVWNYINTNEIEYCKLYDMGFHRIGCIGCPNQNANTKEHEFQMYPRMKQAIIRAIKKRMASGKHFAYYDTAEDVFNWWVSGDSVRRNKGKKSQLLLDL